MSFYYCCSILRNSLPSDVELLQISASSHKLPANFDSFQMGRFFANHSMQGRTGPMRAQAVLKRQPS